MSFFSYSQITKQDKEWLYPQIIQAIKNAVANSIILVFSPTRLSYLVNYRYEMKEWIAIMCQNYQIWWTRENYGPIGNTALHVVGFYYIVFSFYYFQKTIFKKDDYQKNLMNQPYFIMTLIAALTLGMLFINVEITFAQEKNETSEIDDSPLITIPQIDESMETNNTSPQNEDKIPLIK